MSEPTPPTRPQPVRANPPEVTTPATDKVLCERCGAERRPVVEINERGVPHGAGPEHRQVHDYVRILECPGCGHGVLYSFSHDCYLQPWETDEPWDMDWTWRLEPEDLTRLRQDARL